MAVFLEWWPAAWHPQRRGAAKLRVPRAFAAAGRMAIHVAFSHPSFDLWLLLHCQNLSSAEGGSSDAVRAKLRAAHPAYATFAANGEKSVTGSRAQALFGREGQATRHARRLVDD